SPDGGGIRGLSSLIILKHLMEHINPGNPLKPCDYFQLIGGTSTGGLIALMLSRLRMGVDECIEKYIQLSSEAFRLKRSKMDILSRGRDMWKADGKYRSDRLADEFREGARLAERDADTHLFKPDAGCRVLAPSSLVALGTPIRMRQHQSPQPAAAEIRIWEAARATSAASTLFDPIKVGMQEYVDGATGMNNPVEVVLAEAKAIWFDSRERIQCLVSIGTGVPALKNFGDNLLEIKNALKSLSTETERTEGKFHRNHADLGIGGRYFHFNVDNGLTDVGLDEHEKKHEIVAAAELYLGRAHVRDLVADFVKAKAPDNGNVMQPMPLPPCYTLPNR
ncbi:acyl transferase/acyl hydrolase/lysophospholipase, partial [Apodospora peruviana]